MIDATLAPKNLDPNIGQAVAERTFLRKNEKDEFESWGDVAHRVAVGNSSLHADAEKKEYNLLKHLIGQQVLLMSGRHLQHGDIKQSGRNIEVFANCTTACMSWLSFYMLLNGAGVGRDYSDDNMVVDWRNQPVFSMIIDENHPDVAAGRIPEHQLVDVSKRSELRRIQEAQFDDKHLIYHSVEDSREGWAKAVEVLENLSYQNVADKEVLFDFSRVRGYGEPITGVQGKPASGPGPLMHALLQIASLRYSRLPIWHQTMLVDHWLAACVVIGGVRRCMPAGTLVTLNSGVKKIEDVKVGDLVKTPKGVKPVKAVFEQGRQELVTIKHIFGELKCTPNHQVAVFTAYDDWDFKRADELTPGDRLVFDPSGWDSEIYENSLPDFEKSEKQRSNKNTTGTDIVIPELDEDICWLLGLLHSDGYVRYGESVKGAVTIAKNKDDIEILEKAKLIVDRFGINSKINYVKGENTAVLRCSSVQLAKYFHENFKQPKVEMNVPNFIMNGPRSFRGAYLSGVLDGDGSCKTRPMVLCSSIYEGYSKQIMKLVLSLGSLPGLRFQDRSNKEWSDIYYVQLKDVINISNLSDYFEEHSVQYSCEKRFSYKGFSFNREMIADDGRLNMRKVNVAKKNEDASLFRVASKTNIEFKAYPVKVESVEFDKEIAETYDIEVEDIHQFTANGFVVHNSARIATKHWRDSDIIDFCRVKADGDAPDFMWSSNNSVMVDADFWVLAGVDAGVGVSNYAAELFEEIVNQQYSGGNGEPGLINCDRLAADETGVEEGISEKIKFISDSNGLKASNISQIIMREVVKKCIYMDTNGYTVNPCSEISLAKYGGMCIIADVVPYMATSKAEAIAAFEAAARALIRVNTMPGIYNFETQRTNRIGVGMTGIFSYAWREFGFDFYDLIDEEKAQAFWQTIAEFSQATVAAADQYADEVGVPRPHTVLTNKPAGSTSKLINIEEGAHLPARRFYLRWVQFKSSDPLIVKYAAKGYPTKVLSKQYKDVTIVGFPTAPLICQIMPAERVVTASEATPAEQYQWLHLLEKYWLNGGAAADSPRANQISYTLKYDPKIVSKDDYKRLLLEHQSKIKCCSVLPESDGTAYEYLPEEEITQDYYEELLDNIAKLSNNETIVEDIGYEHLACEGGQCPIDFKAA